MYIYIYICTHIAQARGTTATGSASPAPGTGSQRAAGTTRSLGGVWGESGIQVCWRCAIVGVPWRGSVSAGLAWGDLFVNNMFKQVLKRLSLLRHHGTPMMAHLQPPESSVHGNVHVSASSCGVAQSPY